MSEDVVLVDVADGVATITINRPGARNALNRAVRSGLPRAITACEADDGVDVMILTGADPAFSAGVDLKEIGAGAAGGDDLRSGPAEPEVVDMGGRNEEGRLPWRGALPPRTKLLIGAVNWVAVTGGFELALGCDFLIASEHARFADTHARVGVMPGWGLTVLLPQRIGVARAREMSVTGNFLDAPTALVWGLVNHVVPHDELLPFTRQLALDVASNDASGVQNVLATYREEERTTDFDTRRIELRRSQDWLASQSGVADELAKRREAVMARGRSQQG
jgi:enoyl-CoA hydratase